MKDSNGRPVKRSWGVALAGIVLVGGGLVMAGCGSEGSFSNSFSGGFRDLEGIPPQDPEQVILMNNVDGFPNVVAVCVEGAGFATTTREAAGSLIRVEEWDASNGGWCAR